MTEGDIARMERKLDKVVDAQTTMQSDIAVLKHQVGEIGKTLQGVADEQEACPARRREIARAENSRTLRTIGIILGGLAALATVAGVVFTVMQ
jgi:septal ring factor EnvC (AmiA/AmiB activator)